MQCQQQQAAKAINLTQKRMHREMPAQIELTLPRVSHRPLMTLQKMRARVGNRSKAARGAYRIRSWESAGSNLQSRRPASGIFWRERHGLPGPSTLRPERQHGV